MIAAIISFEAPKNTFGGHVRLPIYRRSRKHLLKLTAKQFFPLLHHPMLGHSTRLPSDIDPSLKTPL